MILELPATFAVGALVYGTIEILTRGWTHWSMLLAGGICVCTMYYAANFTRLPHWQKWILSAMIITTVEFLCGILFNLRLGWHIWDYSTRPMNLLGQICPKYTFIWLCLSIPGEWLCRILHRFLK